MRVLVACEFSGTVRDAFLALGHDAWSCDLEPSNPPHYRGDVRDILANDWDLAVCHPPCLFLTIAAEWAYNDPDFSRYPGCGYHQKVKPGTLTGAARREAREGAIGFVQELWRAPIPYIAIENPVGILSSRLCKPSQIIQPYEFGDDASKKTCLWLKNLPLLRPTKYVAPRIVGGKQRWANQTDSGQNNLSPSPDRWKLRSVTYQGIAAAIAAQWSEYILAQSKAA